MSVLLKGEWIVSSGYISDFDGFGPSFFVGVP